MKPWIGILLAIGVLVAWGAVGFAPYYFGDRMGLKNGADRGQFGDMFGAVNSLFSALAFLGVIYAVLLQTQELREQREGAEGTLAEMRRANDAQERANVISACRANISVIQMLIARNYEDASKTVTDPVYRDALKNQGESLYQSLEAQLVVVNGRDRGWNFDSAP